MIDCGRLFAVYNLCQVSVIYQALPPLKGCLGHAEKMQVQDVREGGEDKDAQKKAGITCWCGGVRCLWAQKKGRGKMLMQRDNIFVAWTATHVLRRCFFGGPGSPKKGFYLHFYNVFLLAHEKHMLL